MEYRDVGNHGGSVVISAARTVRGDELSHRRGADTNAVHNETSSGCSAEERQVSLGDLSLISINPHQRNGTRQDELSVNCK